MTDGDIRKSMPEKVDEKRMTKASEPKEETPSRKVGEKFTEVELNETTKQQSRSNSIEKLKDVGQPAVAEESPAIEVRLEVSEEQLANKGDLNNEEPELDHLRAAEQFVKCDSVKKRSTSGAVGMAPKGCVRHMVAILALSSIMLANMNRQAFNQAIVRMTRKPKAPTDDLEMLTTTATAFVDQTTFPSGADEQAILFSTENPAEEPKVEVSEQNDDLFDWTGNQISWLQTGFAYGYTPFMIPGGRLSELYGAKWVVFLCGFGSALCSLLTPFLADTSFVLLVGSRILMGICQTGVSPALYALLTRWLPPEESSVYLPMIKVGVMLGFTSGSLINGFLPWRLMFYLVGLVSLLWSAIWVAYVSSEPLESNSISKEELVWIRRKLGYKTNSQSDVKSMRTASVGSIDKKRKQPAPWLRILTNPAVLGFMFCKFTVKLSTDAQTMQVPMYLKQVFQVSDELNGTLNACNFAIQAIFTGFVAYLAKEFVVRKLFGLNKTAVRRLFQGINSFGMGLAYLLISLNGGSLILVCCAVILLAISSMFGAGGEAVLPVDLTTEYSASIMAIANSVANLSGMILPSTVQFLLGGELANTIRWNYVWWFVCLLMTLGGLIFGLFARAEIQDFSSPSAKSSEESEKRTDVPAITMVEIKSN